MITPPTTRDGRNLDPALTDARGEGATIESHHPESAWPVAADATPAPTATPSETYYDLPVVKEAPWRWYVPAYFYVGGLAGAASTLAAAAELTGQRRFARRLHLVATAAEVLGGGLLIADLGKPARFIYMFRVFRPTSPMNVGTWILSAASASSGLALIGGFARRHRRPTRQLGIASAIAAVTGAMLSTYTGVLLGNTAIPVWQATRNHLPLQFAASSATAMASLLELAGAPRRGYSIVAKTADLATTMMVERRARTIGVGKPLREGRSGRMWRSAAWLGAASLAATVLRRPRLAGVLGVASTVLVRFAWVEAGKASAADPRATFETQRAAAALST